MYTDEWLRVEDVWLHYQDWPARDATRAETVLLLHGLTQQSHAVDAVATQLTRRHRCLALDLRGRGESGWAPGTYPIPRYVLDVLALLDGLRLWAVHLLGTSLGGLIGLSLAGAARVAAYASTVPERFPDLGGAVAWAIEQYPWLAGRSPEAVLDQVRWAVPAVAGSSRSGPPSLMPTPWSGSQYWSRPPCSDDTSRGPHPARSLAGGHRADASAGRRAGGCAGCSRSRSGFVACGGPRRILGAVTEPHAVRRLIAALGLAAESPPPGRPVTAS